MKGSPFLIRFICTLNRKCSSPSPAAPELPSRGRLFALDKDNRHGIVSSVSLTCAMQELESVPYLFHRSCLKSFAERLPLRGSWLRSRLIGRKWNPAAKGRAMVRLPLGELSPEAAEGRIRPFDHCHSFCFSSFLPGSFPTGSSPHPLSAELPFRGEPFCVWIETIGMGSFHQSVSHVPAVIDELTRLRFAPAPSQHLRGW